MGEEYPRWVHPPLLLCSLFLTHLPLSYLNNQPSLALPSSYHVSTPISTLQDSFSLLLPFPIYHLSTLVHIIPHHCLGHQRPPSYPSSGHIPPIYDRLHVSVPSCGSYFLIFPISLIPQIRFSPGLPWQVFLSEGDIESTRGWWMVSRMVLDL